MSKIISVHSFRGGTGKSNTTANLAYQLALMGKRVAVVDTDIQSPGIHILFGLRRTNIGKSLNDYLWGRCTIDDAVTDVSIGQGITGEGKIYLIPSSAQTDEIVNVLREGYDVNLLTQGYRRLSERLNLDVLLIDTHPGLNEDTLFSIAISHALLIVMRPDHQDYEGTGVTVEVAKSLEIPDMAILVNRVPPIFDARQIRTRVQQTYGVDTVRVLPHCDEMMNLASAGIFSVDYPEHELTSLYLGLAETLLQ